MASVPSSEELEGMPQKELRKVLSGLREDSPEWNRVWGFMTDESRDIYALGHEGR